MQSSAWHQSLHSTSQQEHFTKQLRPAHHNLGQPTPSALLKPTAAAVVAAAGKQVLGVSLPLSHPSLKQVLSSISPSHAEAWGAARAQITSCPSPHKKPGLTKSPAFFLTQHLTSVSRQRLGQGTFFFSSSFFFFLAPKQPKPEVTGCPSATIPEP